MAAAPTPPPGGPSGGSWFYNAIGKIGMLFSSGGERAVSATGGTPAEGKVDEVMKREIPVPTSASAPASLLKKVALSEEDQFKIRLGEIKDAIDFYNDNPEKGSMASRDLSNQIMKSMGLGDKYLERMVDSISVSHDLRKVWEALENYQSHPSGETIGGMADYQINTQRYIKLMGMIKDRLGIS